MAQLVECSLSTQEAWVSSLVSHKQVLASELNPQEVKAGRSEFIVSSAPYVVLLAKCGESHLYLGLGRQSQENQCNTEASLVYTVTSVSKPSASTLQIIPRLPF